MATYLLKKSYQIKDLKNKNFKDLWGSHGVFTTMRLVGKPGRLIFYNEHISNLKKSLLQYGIRIKNINSIIKQIIDENLSQKINYNHLLRIAFTKKLISISIRKRLKLSKNFELKVIYFKRIDPITKNLYYKKILKRLSKENVSKVDIALVHKNKILETCTSNLLFIKNKKYYSPKNNCYIGNTIKFLKKKIPITFKEININDIKNYEEILLIGSGKWVTPVNVIKKFNWNSKSKYGYYKINHYLKLK